jgi:hypothetical protein
MNFFAKEKIQNYYKNKGIVKNQVNKYIDLIKDDIMHRIVNRLSIRFYRTVKIKKTLTYIEIIGCSHEELKYHLEKKFKDGMTFQNYGEWELDHIYPISKYDLTNLDQIKECFNYKNIQPLWKSENRSKYNKIIQPKPQNNIHDNIKGERSEPKEQSD